MSRHAELIKAWADGVVVQYLHAARGEWLTLGPPGSLNAPNWTDSTEYRLKPASMVSWHAVLTSGATGDSYGDRHDALDAAGAHALAVLRIEINPDTLELVSATMEKP